MIGPDPEWEVEGTLRGYARRPGCRSPAPDARCQRANDRLTPPSVAHAIFDGLAPDRRRLHVFERSAHRPWVEQPDEYFEVVGRFLD